MRKIDVVEQENARTGERRNDEKSEQMLRKSNLPQSLT
jgi:hypothetical protein